MDKWIPILPCADIKAQIAFYQHLGFEIVEIFERPNAYASMMFGGIDVHFYGNRRHVASENPNCFILHVEDVDAMNEAFASGLKAATGRIPRSGIPKITKVRDLAADRRFTLTDTGGNTIYVLTPNPKDYVNHLRVLESKEYADDFAILYDLIYSKEDRSVATNMLRKMTGTEKRLNAADREKFMRVAREIDENYGI